MRLCSAMTWPRPSDFKPHINGLTRLVKALAPSTVSGTKNRLPREIERELVMLEDGPREALDSCYVEGS